ncbi:enoyl-CoA hydratase/carnithine racemase [Thermocatellispora tengchongensis]|uniref:Enoyl-CoA hydratase/carnithine racemase n=2 Tax=Thermocatellispora tengchongensis TaxID=1073253 RepID=A0A840PI40_9ACTN|nr:enoyl-CoA hydratase/isomerase family protein [Thermocatellispora tengchongensis]MBB5137471.1 enoyl-CoA hydratase/carnithine racemase [Thermocatellispora tengchongensis]
MAYAAEGFDRPMDRAAPPGGEQTDRRPVDGGAAGLRLPTLRLEQSGRVLTAWVDAPPFNYMTSAMQQDFIRLVEAVEHDDSVGAVVVTGALPGRFITHFDIAQMSSGTDGAVEISGARARNLYRGVRAMIRWGGERLLARSSLKGLLAGVRFQDMALRLMYSPAVWIAAVNGPCGGGGLEMSVFFDMRVSADRDACFGLPELSLGLTTTLGAQRLAQLVGPSRALEMMLEARFYAPREALELGLVNRVVPAEDLLDTVQRMAERYARRPRKTVALQKRIFNDAHAASARASLSQEAAAALTSMMSPASQAAMRQWVRMQEGTDGDSVFLTRPEPWTEGTALDMNVPTGGPVPS